MPRPLLPLLALLLTATLLAAAYPRPARCKCQLRSWIVAAQGRHLYLQIDCPKPYRHLSGRVEFTEARLRSDYQLPSDPARRNRLAKLDRPGVLRPPPFITDPKERLESAFTISPDEAACLQRDRVFYAQYELLGPNSNSALRAAAAECGCEIPAAITASAGLFGDFPGIERQPGPELPAEQFPLYGLPEGPQPVPTPLKRWNHLFQRAGPYTVSPVPGKKAISKMRSKPRATPRAKQSSAAASAELRALRELAELHSVMPAYTDASGKRRSASVESLRAVLHGLGVSANSTKEITAAKKAAHARQAARLVEPVNVIWTDSKPSVAVNNIKGAIDCTLELETGETHRWSVPASNSGTKAVRLPPELPMGYHKLTIAPARGPAVTTTIISAPVRSWAPESEERPRHWGLFTPVYALRSSRDMGHGDLTEWRELARWADSHGARAFATLPLLPAFLDEPFDPSPYAPISRLFWNELFADVTRSPEFASAPGNTGAPGLLRSGAERREIGELRALPLVDYKRSATLQRTALDRLSRIFFESKGDQSPAFKRYCEQHPELHEYAKFRAVGERLKSTWDQWPARLRDAQLKSSDYDGAVFRRHLYSQFLVGTQLADCAGEMEARGQLPYLDLPVGVSPFGYDVWRRRDIWAAACSTGAPPDPYFTTGQNWGFPPMHPERCRDEAYAYVIASLRHHMRHAAYLRADHVMALHRLFWIPTGATPADGVYVTYNADEMWAILCLESHRNHCRVVGENLGTVPKAVNDRMVRHDVGQLYVVQYELNPDAKAPLRDIPANSAASINTHDMAQFAHYIEGGDIDDRVRLNMLAPEKAPGEHESRQRAKKALAKFLSAKKLLPPHVSAKDADAASLMQATLRFLAASDAEIVLVNMEDLWQELHWQNIPGTQHEHDNWRHKLALDLDALRSSPQIAAILKQINDARTATPKSKPKPKPKKKPVVKKKPRRLTAAR